MRTTIIAVAFAFVASACGGGAQATVEHRLDDKVLAPVPPEARSTVADAYAAHWSAEKELDRWRFRRSDAQYELKIAKAEKRRAEADRSMASLEAKRSEAAFLSSMLSKARKAVDLGKKSVRAQDLKIRYLESFVAYLDKEVAAAQAKVVAKEAAFELAKAKLAQERGIKPKGFKPKRFADQARKASSVHKSKRRTADGAKQKAERKRRGWVSARK